MKLQRLTLKNFRGIREPLSIELNDGQSLLLYGDNGTGKSSFADAVEWYAKDGISFLSGEEIEKHGGLRNALSLDSEEAYVEIKCSTGKVGKKTLNKHRGKLKSEFSDPESELISNSIRNEQVLIRNRDLVSFLMQTKTDRLGEISRIIGFDEILSTKDTLKKAANSIKNLQKARGFGNLIDSKKNLIFQRLKAAVHNRDQFYEAINLQLKTLGIDLSVRDAETLKAVKERLKAGTNENLLKTKSILEQANKAISDSTARLESLSPLMDQLIGELNEVHKNKESIKQISLSRLLLEAEKAISLYDKDECPLCLKQEPRENLIELVKGRIQTLEQVQERLKQITQSRDLVIQGFQQVLHTIRAQAPNLQPPLIEGIDLQPLLGELDKVDLICNELNTEVASMRIDTLKSYRGPQKLLANLKDQISSIIESQDTSSIGLIADFHAVISICEVAYDEIEVLDKENQLFERQKSALESIYSNFIFMQREKMRSFLDSISEQVNEYFLFMNIDKKIDSISLSTVDDSAGEFAGVAVQFKFHDEDVSSPKKYLSESYLNSLGLCIFLASMKLFNSTSKFIIFDDVISSFDKNHRVRFGQLLDEKFSDYQLLIFTHETDWFNFMADTHKGKGWKITKTRWDKDHGTTLDQTSFEMRDQIEERFTTSNENGLGNLLRRYSEKLFKEHCLVLGAELKFKYNEHNERRNPDELFSALRGRLKKKSDLCNNPVIDRLAGSKFITNSASHDSPYQENLGDLRPVWTDLLEFDSLLRCPECCDLVSEQRISTVKKVITCKCGKKEISWKG